MDIISELSTKDLLRVAQTLVGHQTNRIETALEKHLLRATPDKVRHDLNRIGIVQCQGCSIWWWADQTTDGYCHSLCGGADVNNIENATEFNNHVRERHWKWSFVSILRKKRQRRVWFHSPE